MKNMKLLFDLTRTQPLGKTQMHGGGKYGIAVFLQLVRMFPEHIAAYYNDALYIDPIVLQTMHEKNITAYKQSDISIVDAIRKEGGWAYAPLSNLSYIHEDRINVICTVHGVRALEMPEDKYEAYYENHPGIYRLKHWLKRLTGRESQTREIKRWQNRLLADNVHFVTVSEHSKYALLSFLPKVREDKIKVFYSPCSILEHPAEEQENMGNLIDGKYWIMVSGNRWYKNIIRGIMAFDQLFTEHQDLIGDVVLTGVSDLSQFHIHINNPNRFHCVGFVSEAELQQLYRNAYALLYPSLNEGFGYPPLEAMHEGCPVMASAIASIPEVCGDAVLYFNPYLISEIKMRVLQMENREIHEKYIRLGRERENRIKKMQEQSLSELCRYIISFVQ